MRKLSVFILAMSMISIFSYGEEFQELSPIEDRINIELENYKAKQKDFEEEAHNVIEKEKGILKEAVNLDETPVKKDENILDLEEKKVRGGIVYTQEDTQKPYTGAFGLFLGDFLEYKEEYVNGVLNGDKVWYSDNGNIVLQEHYKNNNIYGNQKSFYENGKVKSIVKYDKGRVVKVINYDKDGNIIHEDDFKNGTGTFKYFWENGNVSEVGKYKNWHKDGKWKKYKKNGELDKVTTYKNGRIESEYWY